MRHQLEAKKEKLSVIGMGYVGLPLAVAFAKKGVDVIGFDISQEKIDMYNQGIDPTEEVGNQGIKESTVIFTTDLSLLKTAKFHIVAVPTPIKLDKTPDLSPVEGACVLLGKNLTKGSYVIFESTVYPGVTEDVCIPILEKESGLKCGVDFKVGYSPERINPGDKVNRLETIVKIVAAMDEESLEAVAQVYEMVIDAGVHKASSIKVAEAAKVIENSQRDINIAFINEMAMALDKMQIDTVDVVNAMNTKWNALGFIPGLVGGHCIGIDPYYFIYEAEKLGYHSQLVSTGRKINDGMGQFVGNEIIRRLAITNKNFNDVKVVLLGFTFKENCPDPRNTKVVDIISYLNNYGINPIVIDPIADSKDVFHEYGIKLQGMEAAKDADCLIFAVPHTAFTQMTVDEIGALFKKLPTREKVIIDVKSMLDKEAVLANGYNYWRL